MPRIISREERLQRDRELLNTALQLIRKDNLTSLSMDKLVGNVPYSKGTVYNHFCSKEDLLLGLCNCGMEIVADLFERTLSVQGNGRDRILALSYAYTLYAALHREQFFLHVQAKTPALYEKGSAERIACNVQLEEKLVGHVLHTVEQAVSDGDLNLTGDMDPLQVAFHLWASAFGALVLAMVKERSPGPLQINPSREMFNQMALLLDGLHWKPLTPDWNTGPVFRQLQRIFADELKQLAEMGSSFLHECPGGANQ